MLLHILLCILNCMSIAPAPLSPAELGRLVRALGINQEEIALATGVTQPHVSRILSGEVSCRAKAYRRVCDFVRGRSTPLPPRRISQNKELVGAISAVWDGSNQQAMIIAGVIRSLAPLTKRRTKDG